MEQTDDGLWIDGNGNKYLFNPEESDDTNTGNATEDENDGDNVIWQRSKT